MLSPGQPAVSIHTLGAFHITRNGVAVPASAWQSTKGPELLKILITQRGPVARKQLVELLWSEADPAVAGNRLSMLLSTVRRVLRPQGGAEPLGSDGSEVWLDRAGVVVDVDQFLTLAAAALHAHRSNRHNATALLHAAAAVYAGDFLPDDPPRDWAIPLADQLEITHLAVLQALANHPH
jgi:DNA-binding SARP family transcriptional activator